MADHARCPDSNDQAKTAPQQSDITDDCIVYDRETIDDLDPNSIWNLTRPQLAYIAAMVRDGVHSYIDNVPPDVEYGLVSYKGCALPFTISTKQETVFPVSPRTCWFSYARLLYKKSYGREPAPVSNFSLGLMEKFARFERLVILNNWFFTNNPTPRFSAEHINAFVKHFAAAYPKYMILIKSIPENDPTQVITTLRSNDFDLIKFRFMHYWSPSGPNQSKRTKQFRRDRNLLRNTSLRTYYTGGISESQSEECERLYQTLYLEKHTSMNTQLNRRWFYLGSNTGFLDIFMIEQASTTKGLVVSYDDPVGVNVGTCGYDLSEPRATGLYRMLVASTLRQGVETGKTVNLSTSVARFKELRGCYRVIEYEGVYTKHLSIFTRLLMKVFAWIYNNRMNKVRCA